MQELPFLHSARRLMLIDICMKFREDSFRGFQVTERTRFVTDRRTDGHPGKNNMSPNPSGGDIIKTPMLYTAIFHRCKKDNFQMKNLDTFFIFAQNIDCGVHVRTVSVRRF